MERARSQVKAHYHMNGNASDQTDAPSSLITRRMSQIGAELEQLERMARLPLGGAPELESSLGDVSAVPYCANAGASVGAVSASGLDSKPTTTTQRRPSNPRAAAATTATAATAPKESDSTSTGGTSSGSSRSRAAALLASSAEAIANSTLHLTSDRYRSRSQSRSRPASGVGTETTGRAGAGRQTPSATRSTAQLGQEVLTSVSTQSVQTASMPSAEAVPASAIPTGNAYGRDNVDAILRDAALAHAEMAATRAVQVAREQVFEDRLAERLPKEYSGDYAATYSDPIARAKEAMLAGEPDVRQEFGPTSTTAVLMAADEAAMRAQQDRISRLLDAELPRPSAQEALSNPSKTDLYVSAYSDATTRGQMQLQALLKEQTEARLRQLQRQLTQQRQQALDQIRLAALNDLHEAADAMRRTASAQRRTECERLRSELAQQAQQALANEQKRIAQERAEALAQLRRELETERSLAEARCRAEIEEALAEECRTMREAAQRDLWRALEAERARLEEARTRAAEEINKEMHRALEEQLRQLRRESQVELVREEERLRAELSQKLEANRNECATRLAQDKEERLLALRAEFLDKRQELIRRLEADAELDSKTALAAERDKLSKQLSEALREEESKIKQQWEEERRLSLKRLELEIKERHAQELAAVKAKLRERLAEEQAALEARLSSSLEAEKLRLEKEWELQAHEIRTAFATEEARRLSNFRADHKKQLEAQREVLRAELEAQCEEAINNARHDMEKDWELERDTLKREAQLRKQTRLTSLKIALDRIRVENRAMVEEALKGEQRECDLLARLETFANRIHALEQEIKDLKTSQRKSEAEARAENARLIDQNQSLVKYIQIVRGESLPSAILNDSILHNTGSVLNPSFILTGSHLEPPSLGHGHITTSYVKDDFSYAFERSSGSPSSSKSKPQVEAKANTSSASSTAPTSHEPTPEAIRTLASGYEKSRGLSGMSESAKRAMLYAKYQAKK